MKKFSMLAAAMFLVVLAGCNLSAISHPVGIPTATLSVSDVSNYGTTLSFTIKAYTPPGSPGGTINKFTFADGNVLAGPRLEACPITSKKDCGPFSIVVTISTSSTLANGSVAIVSYTVVGENGAAFEQELPTPLIIY